MLGERFAERARAHPNILEQPRTGLLADIAAVKHAPAPRPVEHWAIAEPYAGIEHAQLVIVNVRNDAERRALPSTDCRRSAAPPAG